MEDRIKKLLKADEYVRWTGRPEKDPFLNDGNRSSMILRWILSAVVAVALSVAYAVYCSSRAIPY